MGEGKGGGGGLEVEHPLNLEFVNKFLRQR